MPSIIENPAKQLSITDRQSRVAQNIRMQTFHFFTDVKKRYETLFNIVWNNPLGLTPQQALDGMGSNAVELFQYSDLLRTMLTQVDESYIPPQTPNKVSINEDGTVIVGSAV